MGSLRVGVDIGGTFTDLVAYDESRGNLIHLKMLTTPREPGAGFMKILESLDRPLNHVKVIVHATTLGTNMFLGQAGLEPPRTVLVTNKGFIDVVEIGRQNRPELYNVFFEKPRPLVPRHRRIGVKGRIDHEGREIEPLDEEEVRNIARRLCRDTEVFAVSLLHSYANPSHEERVKKILMEECPHAIVVTSSEVDPQPKEYERTSTTLVNALLRPMLSRYLQDLQERLAKKGYRGRLLVMRSSGGVADASMAMERPAAFIESGPAAGAVAVAYMAGIMGIAKALGFDMGGTTAKASAIINGRPEIVSEYEVGGRVHMGRMLRGSGYPVRFPYIDLAEVSAGGGTIAWVDEGGALRVGPISAGADPGPACYGRGGRDPTITDANLLLGRLPLKLAGGTIVLSRELAEKAVGRIASRLGMSVVEAASGIIRIANTVMARALRLVSLERGHDPREFSLFAFGGAGPLHAAELAEELGVREVIIPPLPGVFSALGLLVTDYRHDYHTSIVKSADKLGDEELGEVYQTLEERALRALREEGIPEEKIRVIRMLDMRYWGQAYELTVPYRGSIVEAVEEFHRLHEARYGYSMPDERVEVVVARLEALGLVEKPRLPEARVREYRPEPRTRRKLYTGEQSWVKAPVYDRAGLRPGAMLEGPAVIESDESTIYVPPGHLALVDSRFSVHVKKGW